MSPEQMKALAKLKLSGSELRCILQIAAEEGHYTAATLAEATDLSVRQVERVLPSLYRRGIIEVHGTSQYRLYRMNPSFGTMPTEMTEPSSETRPTNTAVRTANVIPFPLARARARSVSTSASTKRKEPLYATLEGICYANAYRQHTGYLRGPRTPQNLPTTPHSSCWQLEEKPPVVVCGSLVDSEGSFCADARGCAIHHPKNGSQNERGEHTEHVEEAGLTPSEEIARKLHGFILGMYREHGWKVPKTFPDVDSKMVRTKWTNSIQRLSTIDEYEFETVEAVLEWLFTSDHRDARFWRKQVRSAPQLRSRKESGLPSKFDRIHECYLEATKEQTPEPEDEPDYIPPLWSNDDD